jgi:hypothetical protein
MMLTALIARPMSMNAETLNGSYGIAYHEDNSKRIMKTTIRVFT